MPNSRDAAIADSANIADITNQVWHGDCLELMKDIPDKSIDLILCDLPYGTTACKWDVVIPFDPLWKQYKRIVKTNAAIVLTASQPFTSQLVMSNLEWFKHEWVWKKRNPRGFLNAKKAPLKNVENILVFYKNPPVYNPQGLIKVDKKRTNDKSKNGTNKTGISSHNGGKMNGDYVQEFSNYPTQILEFESEKGFHPTQKPVPLFEYLIKTYTKVGDLILDNCAGSGTTAIAALNTNRKYLLMEKDDGYFELCQERIKKHSPKDYSVLPESPVVEKTGQLALF